MLTHTLILSGVVAFAAAAAAPAITPAPARRQLGDLVDDALDNVGEDLDNIGGEIGDIADGLGDDINSIADDIGSEVVDGATRLGGSVECLSSMSSLLADMPMPTGDLVSALISAGLAQDITDGCVAPTLPPSLSAEYAKYTSSASAWYEDKDADISAARSACPTIAEEFSLIQNNPCETGAAGQGGDGGDDDDEDEDDKGDEGAAPRVTGMLAAVAAIAVGAGAFLL